LDDPSTHNQIITLTWSGFKVACASRPLQSYKTTLPRRRPFIDTELVHSRGDDPLVEQETMSQLSCEQPKSVLSLEKGSAIGLEQ
jgi:hypothetical protein